MVLYFIFNNINSVYFLLSSYFEAYILFGLRL